MKVRLMRGGRLVSLVLGLMAGAVAEDGARPKNPDNLELVRRIREKILKRSAEKCEGGEKGLVTVKVPRAEHLDLFG